jgi:ATP-dependent DNA helicase RecG
VKNCIFAKKMDKMENTNVDFISKLLTDLESDRIERTVSTTDTNKFNEAICAFANDYPNHRQAGYLLLGVKDDGELSGLTVTDKLLKELAAIRHNGQILPQPAMSVQKYTIEGKDIIVVEVTPSLHPPVRFRGRVWIRTGPTKAVANETEERILIEKRTATAKTFDALPCWGSSIEDLNINTFKYDYLPTAIDEETLIENHRELKQQLTSLRLFDLKHNCPTNAGILCLGIDPLHYMPGAYIQYVKFDGKELSDTILSEKAFKGNLVHVLRLVDDFLKYNIMVQKPVFISVLQEKQIYNYPYKTLRELTMNAIMHRNYESNAPIKLYEFSDRIVIQNSGGLYGEANIENFPTINDYRNPVIAEIIKNLGFVNRFNVGISNAKKALQENGSPELVFDLSLQTQFIAKVFPLFLR